MLAAGNFEKGMLIMNSAAAHIAATMRGSIFTIHLLVLFELDDLADFSRSRASTT